MTTASARFAAERRRINQIMRLAEAAMTSGGGAAAAEAVINAIRSGASAHSILPALVAASAHPQGVVIEARDAGVTRMSVPEVVYLVARGEPLDASPEQALAGVLERGRGAPKARPPADLEQLGAAVADEIDRRRGVAAAPAAPPGPAADEDLGAQVVAELDARRGGRTPEPSDTDRRAHDVSRHAGVVRPFQMDEALGAEIADRIGDKTWRRS